MSPRPPRLRGLLAPVLACTLVSCAVRNTAPGGAPAPSNLPASQARATQHVLALKAYVYRGPQRGPKAPPFVSLPIGTPVIVSPEPVPGTEGGPFRRILEGEGAGGFVPAEDLQDSAPSAPEALERARAFLAEADLDEAVVWGERSAALDASSREAWDLLAAVHDARGDVTQAVPVYERRARLAALPAPAEEPPRWPQPTGGESRYSAATKLRVRAKPSRKAKILAELELNTPVQVLNVQGEFTKIAWKAEAKDVWVVHLDSANTEATQAAARREGWVGTAYLAPQPATRAELLTRADEAEPQGRLVEAARALERAALLAPDEFPLVQRLTRVAARARLYPLAALSARRTNALLDEADAPVRTDVTLDMFYGCTQEPPVNAAEACTPRIDTLGDCEPSRPLGVAGELEMSGGDMTDEEIAAEDARRQAKYEPVRAEYDKAQAQLERSNEALRAEYPSGPWVYARIEGSRELHAAGQRVFVYALDFSISSECSESSGSARYRQMKLSQQPRPWPDEGETLDVWVTGGGYEEVIYGVVAAKSEAEARALVEPESDEENVTSPEQLAPQPSIAGPWRSCDSCSGC